MAVQSLPLERALEAHTKFAAAQRCQAEAAICKVYKWCNTGTEVRPVPTAPPTTFR